MVKTKLSFGLPKLLTFYLLLMHSINQMLVADKDVRNISVGCGGLVLSRSSLDSVFLYVFTLQVSLPNADSRAIVDDHFGTSFRIQRLAGRGSPVMGCSEN